MTVKFSTTQDMPKKKLNHFLVYNKSSDKYDEIKYLTQQDLASGWKQVMPKYTSKKLINHFNIILAFLPEHLWLKIKKTKMNRQIKYKNTKYTISETNQDELMISLYEEISKQNPNKLILANLIDELDESLYSSWLVLRGKYFIENNKKYETIKVKSFDIIATNAADT
jgi:hypothetical protein